MPQELESSVPLNSNNGKIIRPHEDVVLRIDANRPPDGGLKAYSVMIGSFLTNGLIFGVINSYSVIYTVLLKNLKDANVPNADTKAALVGSLTMGTTFLLSPLSGVLTSVMGLRLTATLGGTIATTSLVISSFLTSHVDVLLFTYSILYGLGASLAYTPSLAILGHYFQKYLGLVNGVVAIGSSVFTVIMPPMMTYVIQNYGLPWLFRILAVLTFGIALCGLLFKPVSVVVIEKPLTKETACSTLLKAVVNVQIWRNRKYRLWAISMPIALFGYFVPYVHIQKFILQQFPNAQVNLPLQCIAAASGVGRLVFGYMSDREGVDRIMLQQLSFYVIGILTILLPFVKSFVLLIFVTLGMGLFDGAFIALIGPVAFQFCGSTYAAQAIGCMLGLAAVPLSIGPTIGGYLFSINQSYTLPFVLAGVSPIIGATLMFLLRLRSSSKSLEMNGNISRNSIHV
ncbi:unnamed protein product, partial [Leptidea sinapis]